MSLLYYVSLAGCDKIPLFFFQFKYFVLSRFDDDSTIVIGVLTAAT